MIKYKIGEKGRNGENDIEKRRKRSLQIVGKLVFLDKDNLKIAYLFVSLLVWIWRSDSVLEMTINTAHLIL